MSATMREPRSDATVVENPLDTGIRIVLARRSAAAWERRREPVTFGVPFPKALVPEPPRLALIGANGHSAPTQTRVLDRWSDGSVRWLLVDSQVDATGVGSDELLLRAIDVPNESRMTVEETAGCLTVSTGTAEFRLKAGTASVFESVLVDGRPAILPEASAIVANGADGPWNVIINRVTVDEQGPLRTSVTANGLVTNLTGATKLELILRLHFFVASPVVRMLLCIRNPQRAEHSDGFWDLGDRGSVHLEDLALTFTLACSMPPTAMVSVDTASVPEPVKTPVTLYQDSSGGENWNSTNHVNRQHRVPNSFRGYRLQTAAGTREGLRATPTVAIGCGTAYLAATMPHFWQNFPKAIEATDSSLTVRLFPGQYDDVHEIQGGEQKTHEVFVAFGRDRITAQPLDWCRSRLIPHAEADWYCASGAVSYLTPFDADADRPRTDLIKSAITGNDTFEAKRELIDEYGWRHFGDIYGDHEAVRQPGLVSHYNNQYDPVLGFAREFLRSGDIRWWTQMEELARHVTDIDVYHTDQDKSAYNHGLFWHTYHYGDADSATHRTYPRAGLGKTNGGGPSGEHNYTSGLALHYFLTGDTTSRSTSIASGQYVIDSDDGSKSVFRWLDSGPTGLPTSSGLMGYQGPGRGSGNSLNALVDAFTLSGERRMLDKAEQVIRRCINPRDDVAAQDLLDAERKWFYTMFLQALGKYLDVKAEREDFDAMFAYGRASLLHYAEWMAAHEGPTLDHPERLEFPTETWAAQDIRKSDVFYYAAQHADDFLRARFLERGRYFYSYATETLLGMSTRTLARPIIVLLTSGTLHAWFSAHADARVLPTVERLDGPFDPPSRFVPQRRRAVGRAVQLAFGLGILGILAVSTLLYWATAGRTW